MILNLNKIQIRFDRIFDTLQKITIYVNFESYYIFNFLMANFAVVTKWSQIDFFL